MVSRTPDIREPLNIHKQRARAKDYVKQNSKPLENYCSVCFYVFESVGFVKRMKDILIRYTSFSCPVMGAFAHAIGSPRLLRGEGTTGSYSERN